MSDDVAGQEQTGERKPSRVARLLRWKIVIPTIVLLLLILAPPVYRQWRLAQVPDIGDPFPVSEVLQPIPTEENAYPLFEEAFALRKSVAEADYDEYLDEEWDGWEPADNQLNKYLELNRPALEKWREATEKKDYQILPISRFGETSYIRDLTASRQLVKWCQVEIERLTMTGRPAAALAWLRASFRGSGLVTHNAVPINRLAGAAFFAMSTNSAHKWSHHPDVSRDQLLELLSVVQESERLMERPSEAYKIDYLLAQQDFANWSYEKMKRDYQSKDADAPLGSKWETWLLAEPEFSRRLTAHLTFNYLAFVDAQRRDRPPLLDDDVFDESAVEAGLAPALPAHKLVRLLEESKLLDADVGGVGGFLDSIDQQQARYACLQVVLAAQAYFRDRGHFPERLADLQPEYLSSLPDDPYAPKPMPVVYRRNGDEAVVYSRFNNETDDGGTTVTYDEAGGDLPLDYGFRIRTPDDLPVLAPQP